MLDDALTAQVFDRLRAHAPAPTGAVPTKLKGDAFRSLVACVLSAQSPDKRTEMAAGALFRLAGTPEALLALDDDRLKQAIKPAGLYNMKARNIKNLCRDLLARFQGEVPATRDALMSLPGVGRKCADITLRFTFGQPVVAVDTHVHRVCNRLGLAHGKTEAQTARALEPRVPEGARAEAHMWLIGHGKRICRSRRPLCEDCYLSDVCEAFRAAGPVAPAP